MHATGAAAAAAAMAHAIKVSGTIVRVDSQAFQAIVGRQSEPLVVTAQSWAFGTVYKYLTSYKGLAFVTKSKEPLSLPGRAEIIRAKKIWVPQ